MARIEKVGEISPITPLVPLRHRRSYVTAHLAAIANQFLDLTKQIAL